MPAGLFQHPLPQRQDQAAFFGQRNEVVKEDQAAFGMPPAQQGFTARDLPVAVDLRLVVKGKLLRFDPVAQFLFHGGPLVDVGFHLRIEEADHVAPGSLGLVHGQIGLLHQLFD